MSRMSMVVVVAALLAACGDDKKTAAPDCAGSYCPIMASACSATGDVQYTGLTGTCEAYCAANGWPAGVAGTTGNTLACRIDHANNAAAASGATRTLHCGHAGPSGGNLCGSWCENYCFLAQKNCAAYLTVGQMGFDAAGCAAACAAFPTTGSINGSGNSVQCRIYHAGAAAGAPLPHCAHAAVSSGGAFPTSGTGPCS